MGTKIVYNHKAIEKNGVRMGRDTGQSKKWKRRKQETEILLPGYVPVSIRKWSSCRTLERICNL